jgi:hypothetical protein
LRFHLFGSASSIDRDVIVFVDALPTLEESKQFIISEGFDFDPEKKLNLNFGVLQNGVLTETLKGLPDETNNAVFLTYQLHAQSHRLSIMRLLPRDLPSKFRRATRVILSLHSRTERRDEIKQALRDDLPKQLDCLASLDLSKKRDLGKNGTPEDIYKSIAFQLGQSVGLARGVELYTKEAIAEQFPELSQSLHREALDSSDRAALERFKQEFLRLADVY